MNKPCHKCGCSYSSGNICRKCYLESFNNFKERFFKCVEKTKHCWNWTKGKDRSGYGAITINKKYFGAHRYSWIIHRGKIPKGMHVLHHCDNRGCVKPSHLWMGTLKDNKADEVKKGRNIKGENHPMAKLMMKDVNWIRNNYKNRNGIKISKKYGVSSTTIYYIVHKKTWK